MTPPDLAGIIERDRHADLGTAWAECEQVLPPGYFISNVRHRSPTSRFCASATLDKDLSGASRSGFGGTPADALRDLASKFRAEPEPRRLDPVEPCRPATSHRYDRIGRTDWLRCRRCGFERPG